MKFLRVKLDYCKKNVGKRLFCEELLTKYVLCLFGLRNCLYFRLKGFGNAVLLKVLVILSQKLACSSVCLLAWNWGVQTSTTSK